MGNVPETGKAAAGAEEAEAPVVTWRAASG
jgi:hypothetical protein